MGFKDQTNGVFLPKMISKFVSGAIWSLCGHFLIVFLTNMRDPFKKMTSFVNSPQCPAQHAHKQTSQNSCITLSQNVNLKPV